MRKTLGISLIVLSIGAIVASIGLPLATARLDERERSARADRDSRTASKEIAPSESAKITNEDRPQFLGTAPTSTQPDPATAKAAPPCAPGSDCESDATEPASVTRLDLAPAYEIHRALSEAVDHQSAMGRSLYVDPNVLNAVAQEGRVRVLFDGATENLDANLEARLTRGDDSTRLDEVRILTRLDYGSARVGPEALLALIESDETRRIEADTIHRPTLIQSLPVIGADLAHADGHDGDGRVIAILDTGVEVNHPRLVGRVVEEACFSLLADCPNADRQMFGPGAAAPCPQAGCGHGTHVSGIAAAGNAIDALRGVAPKADLIAIQIFSEVSPGDIGAYSSDILAGMQHVLGLAPFYDVDALNLSLGGSPYATEAECDAAAALQVNTAGLLRAAGIVPVAAAGNLFLTNAITTPGCLSNIVSVGATDDSDAIASFSNSADFLNLLAPGVSIESTSLGGVTAFGHGTSAATPHVAGAIAAIREAHPTATPGEIENALALSGVPVLDARNGITSPRIEIAAAIDFLDAIPPPPAPAPGGAPATGVGSSGGATVGAASPSSSGGGGGGACGLLGIEPFLALGLIRAKRRFWRARASDLAA